MEFKRIMERKNNYLLVFNLILIALCIGAFSYFIRQENRKLTHFKTSQQIADSLFQKGQFSEAMEKYYGLLTPNTQHEYLFKQLRACQDSVSAHKKDPRFFNKQVDFLDSLVVSNNYKAALAHIDTLRIPYTDSLAVKKLLKTTANLKIKQDSLTKAIKETQKTNTYIALAGRKTERLKSASTGPPLLNAEIRSNTMAVIKELQNQFVYVEKGTFKMGQPDPNIGGKNWSKNEQPVHTVVVNDFYISKYEVTQKQWRIVMGENLNSSDCDQCPIEEVSWLDTQDFIRKLNELTGENYRLPTEAEWEYAARGGNTKTNKLFSSSNDMNAAGWFLQNSDNRPHPVGLKRPNALGLYDMSGNVWEWCQDWYKEDYYSFSPLISPSGPETGIYKVLRGGSWYTRKEDCRVTSRVRDTKDGRFANNGFRLAKDVNNK